MTETQIDRWLDGRERQRIARDERAFDLMDRRERDADRMIGTLCRNGVEVLYVFPHGGKYREGTRRELTNFLARNRYI